MSLSQLYLIVLMADAQYLRLHEKLLCNKSTQYFKPLFSFKIEKGKTFSTAQSHVHCTCMPFSYLLKLIKIYMHNSSRPLQHLLFEKNYLQPECQTVAEKSK